MPTHKPKPTSSPLPEYLTIDDMVAALRVDRRTILRMVEDGRLPGLKLGKIIRFDPAAVQHLFDAQRAS